MTYKTKMTLAISGIVVFYALMFLFGTTNILDAKLYYSHAFANDFFANLTPQERAVYLRHEWFDLGLIVSYTSAFFMWSKRLFVKSKVMGAVALIPGAFDLLETSSIIYILANDVQDVVAWLGIITLHKWILGAIIFSLFFRQQLRTSKIIK
jgi:hypothetical protein